MRRSTSPNILYLRRLLLGLAALMALAFASPFSFVQVDNDAAVTGLHAQHVMNGIDTVDGTEPHNTTQGCLLACTFTTARDAVFAFVLVLERRDPQSLILDRDIVTPFGPEIPERPPQSV